MLSNPTWYLTVIPEIQAFLELRGLETVKCQSTCKRELYDFFEFHLSAGNFALGGETGKFDVERLPIDTVVIHHTGNPPGISAIRLSAIELMRLYGPYFADPQETENDLKEMPIFSGHKRNGTQVFWPYHWLIRKDGRADRLLHDYEIGWHAGNWNVNCRSVGIAFDSDLEQSQPTRSALYAAARLIAFEYAQVRVATVLGHREVNSKTACPSELFLSATGKAGWKRELIERIEYFRHTG